MALYAIPCSPSRRRHTEEKAAQLEAATTFANTAAHDGIKLERWLRRPENSPALLPADIRQQFTDEVWSLLENHLKYEGYVTRQESLIQKTARMEDQTLPASIDYLTVQGLKREAQLKLNQIRPATLGQAARVQGVTPADIALLAILLRK